MRRNIAAVLTVFILIGILLPFPGCGSEPDQAGEAGNETITVQRGDLAVEITAVGNLALSSTEELTFDLFYQEGTVEAVLVEEGDTVAEGQALASLDKEEWEEALDALADDVTAEERDLLQAQINLITAEQGLKDAQDNREAKELALLNSQISLDQAKYNLEVAQETYTWPEIEVAEADIERLEAWLEYALESRAESGSDSWDRLVIRYQAELDAAESTLNALLTGYDTEEVAIKKKQVEAAEISLSQAQKTLDKVADDVAKKEMDVKLKGVLIGDASKSLAEAQEKLEEANGKSSMIVAPFDGFITKVNVEGGDEILRGTVALQIADPNKFEAEILVSELDISQVPLGGKATVQVDAMPGLTLSAEVTHISPTAAISQGVVNYNVKVKVASLDASMQEQQAVRQETMQDVPLGEFPEPLKQAIAEGRMSQEQAEEMMKQRQQGQAGQQSQTITTMPADFQLREGLTAIVTIVVQEGNDVLLVPNAAITRQQGQSYVIVVSADGSTEERLIQTGISDFQSTEVTEGLSEGEQIMVPEGTAATTSTTEQGQGRQSGMFIPGMGRPPR
ncbi:HlyD family efflux transporter periplasmic adaptor subunit [Chloroflexota bacterium]